MGPHLFTERELLILEGIEAAEREEIDWRHHGRVEAETFLDLRDQGYVRAVIAVVATAPDGEHIVRGARLTAKGRQALERARRDAAVYVVKLSEDEVDKVDAFLHLFERERARLAEIGPEADDVFIDATLLSAQMMSPWPKREVVRALVIGIGYRFEQLKEGVSGHLLTDPTLHALRELRTALI